MAQQSTLDWREYQAALKVLDREQRTLMPSRRQGVLFRAFNFTVHAFVICGALLIASLFDGSEADIEWLQWLVLALFAAIIPLFVLNWGFIGKLRRQARLRQALGLKHLFRNILSAGQKETILHRIVTITIAMLGALGILLSLLALGLTIFLAITEPPIYSSAMMELALILLIVVAIGLVGTSLLSLHFMWRGKRRTEAVQQMLKGLASQEAAFGGGQEGKADVGAENYRILANIERDQIIRERTHSVELELERPAPDRYRLEVSESARKWGLKLDPDARAKVQQRVFALTRSPCPGDARPGQVPDTNEIDVKDTDFTVIYRVHKDAKVIELVAVALGSSATPTMHVEGV